MLVTCHVSEGKLRGEVPVNVKVLNSHVYFKKYKVMRKFLMKMILIIIRI